MNSPQLILDAMQKLFSPLGWRCVVLHLDTLGTLINVHVAVLKSVQLAQVIESYTLVLHMIKVSHCHNLTTPFATGLLLLCRHGSV